MSTTIDTPVRTQTEVTVREVLHRAADLLEEWGWHQGDLGLGDDGCQRGPMCILGALARARLDYGHVPPILSDDESGFWHDGAYDWAAGLMGGRNHDLYSWNDSRDPDTGKAEVVAKLREAAEASA